MRRRSDRLADALCALSAILVVVGLVGCVTRRAAAPAPPLVPSPLLGQPFDVVAAKSRLIVLVYRAGPLAALGHNHLIACRCATGTFYLPRDPLHASFDVRVAVDGFTVDDPALRSAEHSSDFPPDVPPSAREGTRRNMLGAALLNVAKYPDITLRSVSLHPLPGGGSRDIVAEVLVQLDGEWHSVAVPMHYDVEADEIVASGEFPLRQTDLGLTPFAVMGGALSVRDGMTVRLTLVARRRG